MHQAIALHKDEIPKKNKAAENRVLCHACKKPIHIDDLGLITGDKDGKQKWFHDNYVCLITYVEEKREEEKNSALRKRQLSSPQSTEKQNAR